MLKPIIRIIKTCIVCFIVCLIAAITIEFYSFSHSEIIKDFSIGSACSFIVVIISTLVQYFIESKRAFSESINSISSLIFLMALFQNKYLDLTDKNAEFAFKRLETEFERFIQAEYDLIFFSRRKTKSHVKKNHIIRELYYDFLREQFVSNRDAVIAATDKGKVLEAIDTYLNHWPDCFAKEQIEMARELLVEKSDDVISDDVIID